MNKHQAKKRAEKLKQTIDDLRYRYHVLDDPTVTDEVYDSLTRELREIEKDFPELVTNDSPTQRIGGLPLEKFQKIKHTVTQWSFNDAFSEKEVEDWEVRIKKMLAKKLGHEVHDMTYVCELKIDGLHVVLTYEKGLLKTAATRGDGKVGENVTSNIKTIQSIPLRLREPLNLVVEGEIWLSEKELKRINKQREKDGIAVFANPRNAAAGTIRQLDPKIAASRKLDAFLYDISGGDQRVLPKTQVQELELLDKLGCKVNKLWKECGKISQVLDFWKKWEPQRNSKDFWIDGVVVKVNQRKYQEALGYTGKAPRWALAIKFAAEKATTVLREVHWQVGRTGAITPVATFEPVLVAGSTVTHASLHNEDQVERLGVKVGDTVVIEKAGDIIPKVIQVLPKMRTGKEKKIISPTKCPICDSDVMRRKGEVAIVCTNKKCFAQQKRQLIHFAGKKGFDIEGLGKKIVEQLIIQGLVSEPADFFKLTKGDLEPLERFAEKSAENLVDATKAKKQIPMWKFINALGIRFVGEGVAQLLADNFSGIEKMKKAEAGDFEKIDGIGEKAAQALESFFQENKILDNLLDVGVMPISEHTSGKFKGKVFVFTGSLQNMSRDDAKELVHDQGGTVSNTLSKKTHYLVVGENPGSKLKKAKALGIKIINEKDLR